MVFSDFGGAAPSSQSYPDIPSSPVRKKRTLGGMSFTKRGEDDDRRNVTHRVSRDGTFNANDASARAAGEDQPSRWSFQSDNQRSGTFQTTSMKTNFNAHLYPHHHNSHGSANDSFNGGSCGSPDHKKHKKAVDSSLPAGDYLTRCIEEMVEDIDLMFKGMERLPHEFDGLRHVVNARDVHYGQSHSLEMNYKIMLSQNQLTELEPVLFDGINIVNLSVFNNKLHTIPPRIKDLCNLHTLNVCGNPELQFLPSDIERLPLLRNMKANNVGFAALPAGVFPSEKKERKLLHRVVTVVNSEKRFPSLIELAVTSMFKAKKGNLTEKQIAKLDIHNWGRGYLDKARASFLLGTSCGVCHTHILYEDEAAGYAMEWWQWPGHDYSSEHDKQVVVLKRFFCKMACMTESLRPKQPVGVQEGGQ